MALTETRPQTTAEIPQELPEAFAPELGTDPAIDQPLDAENVGLTGLARVYSQLRSRIPSLPAPERLVQPFAIAEDYDDSVTVADSQPIGAPEVTRHGTTEMRIVRLSDGSTYEELLGTPRQPRTEIPIAMRTALLTSIRGHNEHSLLHFMDLGYKVRLVGPEDAHRDEGWRLRKPHPYSLAQSAHNTHVVLSASDPDQEDFIYTGESWAAMAAFGIILQGPQHGHKIVYTDIVDPCFAEPFDLRDAPKYLWESRHEVPAIARFLGSLTLKRLIHYPSSLNLDPNFWAQAGAQLPVLLSGEAGHLAKQVPAETRMHIQVFMDNLASQGELWQTIFGLYPNVRVSQVNGGHLDIPTAETRFGVDSRLARLRDELERTGDNVEEIDFNKVHLDISTLDEAA